MSLLHNIALHRQRGHELLIWQRASLGVNLLRYAFGAALLGPGLFLLYALVELPVVSVRDGGWAALPSALPGMLVSAVLAAILVPLGYALCFLRRRWRIDLLRRQAVEESDWRWARTRQSLPLDRFESLWLGLDRLNQSTRGGSRVQVLHIRLLPRDADAQAPLDLAWFDPEAAAEARLLADGLAQQLQLPLRVEPADGRP